MRTARVAGIRVVNATRRAFAEQMVRDARAVKDARADLEPKLVFSANGHVIAKYHADDEFRRAIDCADYINADGMPLVFFSRLLGTPLPERIATTDFVLDALDAASENGIACYFLGGAEEDNRAACEFFARRFPRLIIAGRHHGFFGREEEHGLCAEIVERGTALLWVGLGSPAQEYFCLRCKSRLQSVAWIKTCGGLFDYYSGRSGRAPAWMQRSGFEWLYRVLREPLRLGPRYATTNLPALYHLATKTGERSGDS
jgi:exopolysaccharide biosynthesis WecB/TagA/CpsF family protein